MAKATKQRPAFEEETPRGRPRRKRRGRITLFFSVVFAYLDLFFIMVGLGATVQLWTAPGSSLFWKLLLPLLTLSGMVFAFREYKDRPRDPFAGFIRAEIVLTIAGVLILGALAAAPN